MQAGILINELWADPIASTLLGALAERVPLETAKKIAGMFFAVERPLTGAFSRACRVADVVHARGCGAGAGARGWARERTITRMA